MKINTSPNDSATFQRTHSHVNIAICLDPIVYFLIIYATKWSFLLVNFLLISTPSSPWDSPSVTRSSHMVSPPRFNFFNHVQILRTSVVAIHTPYFFRYMVFEYQQHSRLTCIHGNTITKFIPRHHRPRKTSTIPVRFLHIYFSFFSGGYAAIVKINYTRNLINHPRQSI